MPTIDESALAAPGGQYQASLAAGIDTIGQVQTVLFTPYTRFVSPIDGLAYWVLSTSISGNTLSALEVEGSLHYTTEQLQEEEQGYDANTVVFTSLVEVESLEDIAPQTIYVGEFDGVQFAFSRRNSLYRQSGLFHYFGKAIFNSMSTQLVNSSADINLTVPTVSNSLPIWLTLTNICPMYVSYLLPENVTPPYGVVHVEPSFTKALQMAPYIDPATGSHYQLAVDKVRVTFYGLQNKQALAFQDYFLSYCYNDGSPLGVVMEDHIMRDEKQTQPEFNILAQKKTFEAQVSYYQTQAYTTALKYIESAFVKAFFTQT